MKPTEESSTVSDQAPASAFAAAAVQATVASPENSCSSADEQQRPTQQDGGQSLNLLSLSEADALKLAFILRHARLLAADKERSAGTESSGRSTPATALPASPGPLLVRAPSAPEQQAAWAAAPAPSLGLAATSYAPAGNTITTGIPGLKGTLPSGAGPSFHRAASMPTYGRGLDGSRALAAAAGALPLPHIVIRGHTVVPPAGGAPAHSALPRAASSTLPPIPGLAPLPARATGRRAAALEAAAAEGPGSPLGDDSALAAELLLGFREQSLSLPARAHSAPLLERPPGAAGKRGGAAARPRDEAGPRRADAGAEPGALAAPGRAVGRERGRAPARVRLAAGQGGGGGVAARRARAPASAPSPTPRGSPPQAGGGSRAGSPGSRASARVPGPQGPASSRAPPGLTREELRQERGAPLERVERPITNGTYINRLHVTQQMAQLLFPQPEFCTSRGAAREDGPANFNSLFKHRLTIVDEAGEAWPVQYEGFMSSGQRHFRLTSGWSGLMRVQNVAVGDTLVLERWTEDRVTIHLRIERQRS
ncbi:hypothetical protein QBZ16_001957 [Prototheca wickerhamii]|uniref:TF-B3 domain-containing protein n=1 Tax=Prototheca wickerhamii TaxID=3111 RepID=A0AAD9MJ96_PROWI|nr:hypothetical protein QBZ16_001957 [Prototheca wickerhamii]